jgi:hypothetical protein
MTLPTSPSRAPLAEIDSRDRTPGDSNEKGDCLDADVARRLHRGTEAGIDWPVVREELFKYFNDELPGMGVSYTDGKVSEMMVNFWPTADANPSSSANHVAFARVCKSMPKMVFCKTLERAGWNTAVVRETVAEEVAKLKRQPG